MNTGKAIVVAAITGAIVAAGTFFALRTLVPHLGSDDGVVVPSLSGLRVDQARGLLEPRGLMLFVAGERGDPKLARGAIAEQTPMQGSRVAGGSEVRVVISSGDDGVAVPALEGLPLEAAKRALSVVGLKAGEVTRKPDDKVGKDLVLESVPPAGKTAK